MHNTESPAGASVAVTRCAVPRPALLLGGAGLIPVIGLSTWILVLPDSNPPLTALIGYCATILAFLGGAEWGLAAPQGGTQGVLWRRFSLSVMPSLLGWLALLLQSRPAIAVLLSGFVWTVVYDHRLGSVGDAPEWYPRLRWPLSLVMIACLTAVLSILEH